MTTFVVIHGAYQGGWVWQPVAARITMHPIAAMRDPMVLKSFWQQKWKATVIWCRQSVNPPVSHQKRAAEALSASWHEIDTGHYPMLSTPDELARIILA